MAKKWKDVRAKAVKDGRLDEDKLKERKDLMLAEVRAHKLAELRDKRPLN